MNAEQFFSLVFGLLYGCSVVVSYRWMIQDRADRQYVAREKWGYVGILVLSLIPIANTLFPLAIVTYLQRSNKE